MKAIIDPVPNRPVRSVRASRARLASVAVCVLFCACATSGSPVPEHATSLTTTAAPSEPLLGSLRPVEVGHLEDALHEAPVNHAIALGSLDMASLPAHVDAERVERTIAQQLGSIRDCMERKRRAAAPQGKVKVAFTILPAGGVRDARAVHNGTGSLVAVSCVLASVRKLTFDPSPAGEASRVEYSFVFGGGASLASLP